jgi:hypothetical protein
MTFSEAARLDPDEQPGELDDGRWIPVPKSSWRHGQVVGNACALLGQYAKQHPGWSISAGNPGTKLAKNPDRLRGPDVGMVRVEREPKGKGVDGWLEGAPDVVVEVIGDAQSFSEFAKKALETSMRARRSSGCSIRTRRRSCSSPHRTTFESSGAMRSSTGLIFSRGFRARWPSSSRVEE